MEVTKYSKIATSSMAQHQMDTEMANGRTSTKALNDIDSTPNPVEREDTFMKKKRHFKEMRLWVLVNGARVIPLGFAIGAFLYIIVLIVNEDNWSTDSSDTDQVKLDRVKNRGTFVSVLIAILMNVIGSFMFYIKVKEGLVVTNYGFILGPIVGFMLAQGIGTDEGFEVCHLWYTPHVRCDVIRT